MTETQLTNRIKDWLCDNGWLFIKYHGSSMSRAGVPDLVAMKDGRTVWLEIKVDANKVTKLQQYMIDKIRGHGVEVYVIRSEHELIERLET